MDLKLLEDALVLIEKGSMRRAAAARNVTQPAFSRRIRTLEAWLGMKLVERLPNRVVLTRNLLEREAEFRAIQKSFLSLKQDNTTRKRPFIVATQHSLALSIFPGIYQQLRMLESIGPIRLRTRNQSEVFSLFLKSEVDLILSYQIQDAPRLPFDETVIQGVWRSDTLVPIVGGALKSTLSADKKPDPGTPHVNYPEDSEFGKIVRSLPSTSERINFGNVAFETAFAASIISLVKLGTGIGWAPQSLIQDELRTGEVVTLSKDYGRIPMDVVLSADRNNKTAAEALDTLLSNQ